MRFSQRRGYRPVRSTLQVEEVDDDLRVAIWNVMVRSVAGQLDDELPFSLREVRQKYFWSLFWTDFLRLPLDDMSEQPRIVLRQFKNWFMTAEWCELYDSIETVLKLMERTGLGSPSAFREMCNEVLEKEMSAYRVVGAEVCPIVSEEEIDAIETVLEQTKGTPVEAHISRALELMSDRRSPDYRNSIKESISAVEAAVSAFVRQPHATLADATSQLGRQGRLHPALASAFSKLYGYTSDADGIRHALMDEPTLEFADAKFMLVVCTAFTNYLTAKAT